MINSLLHEHLDTKEKIEIYAEEIGVSVATLYRYKAKYEGMPLGKFLKLLDVLGMPFGESASWLPDEYVAEEYIRLGYEKDISERNGYRLTVTPYFTVNIELPELTELSAKNLYSDVFQEKLDSYLRARTERSKIYFSEKYRSKEIINGYLYEDFFDCKKAYSHMSTDMRDKQIKEIIKSLGFGRVQRRIYFGYDLPVITCYSCNVALVRVGEYTVQLRGEKSIQAVENVFNDYFSACQLKTEKEVEAFLLNPQEFIGKIR